MAHRYRPYHGIRELSRDIHEQLFIDAYGGNVPTTSDVTNAIVKHRRCPYEAIGRSEFDRLCRIVWQELIKDPYPFGDTP